MGFFHYTQVILWMQVSLLYLTEKIGQGTKTLVTSDENDDGKNDKKIWVGINNRL